MAVEALFVGSIVYLETWAFDKMWEYFYPTPSSNPKGSDLKIIKNYVTPLTAELKKGVNEHSEMLATGEKVNKETEKLLQRGEDLNNQTRSTVVNIQQLNNDLKSKVKFVEENTRLIQENRDLKGRLCSLEGQMEQNAKEAKEKTQGIENAADKKIKNLNDQNSILKLENDALREENAHLKKQLETKMRVL